MTRIRALMASVSCVGALALLAPACAEESIVLATIPASDAGPAATPTRCAVPDDCPSGSFCVKDACDAPAGTCAFFPAECTNDERPVCGCDRLTYFNDCLRLAAGVAASSPGECPFDRATRCGGPFGASCAKGECARNLGFGGGPPGGPPDCPPDAQGTCWVLPGSCPTANGPNRWDTCGPQGTRCVDTCTAIGLGSPFHRATQCP